MAYLFLWSVKRRSTILKCCNRSHHVTVVLVVVVEVAITKVHVPAVVLTVLTAIACTILFLTRSLTLGKGPVTRPFFNKDVPVIIVVTVQQVCCSNTLLLQLLICFEISFKDSAKCGICLLLIMRV